MRAGHDGRLWWWNRACTIPWWILVGGMLCVAGAVDETPLRWVSPIRPPHDAAPGDQFGFSLATARFRYLAVGSPVCPGRERQRLGRVYLYECRGGTAAIADGNACTLVQTLLSPGDVGDCFGSRVAFCEDPRQREDDTLSPILLVVGASGATHGPSKGRVYVYRCTSDQCGLMTTLEPSARGENDQFGRMVACALVPRRTTQKHTAQQPQRNNLELVLAMGAGHHDSSNVRGAGTVYLYARADARDHLWTESQVLPAAPQTEARFGGVLAVAGSTLAVSAARTRSAPSSDIGVTTLYEMQHVDEDGYVQVRREDDLVAHGLKGPTSDNSRLSFSLTEKFLLATGAYDESGTKSGAAPVFQKSNNDGGSSYKQVGFLTASDRRPGDLFGMDALASDDYFVIGAHKKTSNWPKAGTSVAEVGQVYVFERFTTHTGPMWRETARILPLPAAQAAQMHFGYAIVNGILRDDVIVIGAPCAANTACAGSVYILGDILNAPMDDDGENHHHPDDPVDDDDDHGDAETAQESGLSTSTAVLIGGVAGSGVALCGSVSLIVAVLWYQRRARIRQVQGRWGDTTYSQVQMSSTPGT